MHPTMNMREAFELARLIAEHRWWHVTGVMEHDGAYIVLATYRQNPITLGCPQDWHIEQERAAWRERGTDR